ncbi:TerB N-terminal domain-containing protein [Paenibacillus sp. GCM10028914]|uniref:TerB N-terminal domain-containing protein n=1 Tax=Paenibacillus sp. GCM10028914 TaxID=3273416 RepID=UPI0036235C3B
MEYFRKNNEMNIDNIRHTIVQGNHIRFAEYELGGEEKNTLIPPRKPVTSRDEIRNEAVVQGDPSAVELSMDDLNFWDQKEPNRSSVPSTPSYSSNSTQNSPNSSEYSSYEGVRYYSREQQFVMRARELAWHVEPEHPFVPFKSYWPTYDNMSSEQYKWYFHWREEVRSGRYPDTDLSYLFLYMYELINGIGWSNPMQGWQLLNKVWNAYRQRYSKLDTYTREWLFDFSLIHGLDMPITETYNRIPRSLSSELKELEWLRIFSTEPLMLNWDLLIDLIDYEPDKSRFYQEGGRKDIRKYGPKVIALVDAYLGKTKGQRLLDRFRPREKMTERYVFRSAVYDYDIYGRTASVMTLPISSHVPLRHYITQLFRMMENKLRELRGFKGRLRGIEVEPEIEELVTRFLKKELQPPDDPKEKALPEVRIDRAKLRRIQQESDDVRDMLLLDESELGLQSQGLQGSEQADISANSKKSTQKTQAQHAPLQMDIFEVSLIEDDVIIDTLSDDIPLDEVTEWTLPMKSVVNDGNPEGDGARSMMSAGKDDEVSSQSSLTETTIVAGTDDESLPTIKGAITDVVWDTDALDEEWRELAALLKFEHLEVLYALKTGPDLAALHAAAERAGSMPALLIDEINEAAMETIGDLLIDGETIVDEYIMMLDPLKR